ncbi:MAG: hypothetical protein HQK96_16300 [Nitrospirae bacterium]|nr:hypothetical protein [Nitrospirota bacterium]
MNFLTFLTVSILAVFLVMLWEIAFTIIPAWKRLKTEEARARLSKCLTYIDNDTLLNGKIKNGQYLHDIVYNLLSKTLYEKPLIKLNLLKKIEHNDKIESERRKFSIEIDSLDKETRKNINNAIKASTILLFLQNPLLCTIMAIKVSWANKNFQERKAKNCKVNVDNNDTLRGKIKRFIGNRMTISTEYYAICMIDS